MVVFWDFISAVFWGLQYLFRGDVCRIYAESGGRNIKHSDFRIAASPFLLDYIAQCPVLDSCIQNKCLQPAQCNGE